ncbi:MAG TPA: cytochrome C biogenesis protein [Bacteroidales bacterium]|nr:cytochrome C biogenesis protein [Bacteroidales bacterium]
MLRKVSFSLLGSLVLVLIAGTVVEKFYGTSVAMRYVYTAPYTIVLWFVAVVTAIAYLISNGVHRHVATFTLHLSFAVILLGAVVTHWIGRQGSIHLRKDVASDTMLVDGKDVRHLPFVITLKTFQIDYYPGTRAPMDYVSILQVNDNNKHVEGRVSMNNIFSYRHFRFYQSSYDADGLGTRLSVSYDPYGIAITYFGYVMLLLSMIAFFFQKHSRFASIRRTLVCLILLVPLTVLADDTVQKPRTLQKGLAKTFGNIYVYYNDRVCPASTMATDFTTKLYGKTTYKGLTAEQVLTGWLFYYDDWKSEPMIKIKGEQVRRALGVTTKYASLNDFVGTGNYKLQSLLLDNEKNARAADEKFNLISMVATGSVFKIFPYRSDSAQTLAWYSWVDRLPADIDYEQWHFIKNAMNDVAYNIASGHNIAANDALKHIRVYQRSHTSDSDIPSETKFRAEVFFNKFQYTRPLAMLAMTLGLLFFILYCLSVTDVITLPHWLTKVQISLVAVVFVTLLVALSLRGYISGHWPLSNGHETMQFLAMTASFVALLLCGKYRIALPAGMLVSGMTLMVSMMSAANPQITNLMPVLQSPLLSIHVAVIMISYTMLAFITINSIAALIIYAIRHDKEYITKLMNINALLLYPAEFCLVTGIFIGAVWANISWGRYWGWDPKEVWALITMLIYAFPLHASSLPIFKKPVFMHVYCIIAFFSVLFTYFGVNFLLGGMHSYA